MNSNLYTITTDNGANMVKAIKNIAISTADNDLGESDISDDEEEDNSNDDDNDHADDLNLNQEQTDEIFKENVQTNEKFLGNLASSELVLTHRSENKLVGKYSVLECSISEIKN